MKTIGKLAAIALAASVSLAAASAGQAEGANANSAAAAQTGKKESADSKKYCLKQEALTGSRMSARECKTKAEWRAEGVEISAK